MKPIELLNKHCTFDSPYEVYVLFGISRKKENNCTNSQEKVFREIIKRPEEIERKYNRLKQSVLAYRNPDGSQRKFYIYISVNARDTRKAIFHLQKNLIDYAQQLTRGEDVVNSLNRIDRKWWSILMKPTSRAGRGKFLFDVDDKDEENIKWLMNQIAAQDSEYLIKETKNGYHIVCKPFNLNSTVLLGGKGFFEIKKDALLFVEWVEKYTIGIDYGKIKDENII